MFMEMFHSFNKKCLFLLVLTFHQLSETHTQQLIGRDHRTRVRLEDYVFAGAGTGGGGDDFNNLFSWLDIHPSSR
jgi:hypothetical protein